MKWLSLLPAFFVLSVTLAGAASHQHPESAPAVPAGDYVGSDTCIACHDDSSKTLEPTAHQKLFANKEPSKNGCEACHGPGSKHVDGNGDTEKIFRFAGSPTTAVQSQCGACHTSLGKAHGHQKVNCLSCHSVHHASEPKSLLVKLPPDLCTSCHH